MARRRTEPFSCATITRTTLTSDLTMRPMIRRLCLAALAALACSPALAQLVRSPGERVVIATATLALQTQLATKDIPAVVAACREVTGLTVSHAVLKGRSNYACLYRVRDGIGMTGQDTLLGGAELVETVTASGADATSVLGAEVVAAGLRPSAPDLGADSGLPISTVLV